MDLHRSPKCEAAAGCMNAAAHMPRIRLSGGPHLTRIGGTRPDPAGRYAPISAAQPKMSALWTQILQSRGEDCVASRSVAEIAREIHRLRLPAGSADPEAADEQDGDGQEHEERGGNPERHPAADLGQDAHIDAQAQGGHRDDCEEAGDP